MNPATLASYLISSVLTGTTLLMTGSDIFIFSSVEIPLIALLILTFVPTDHLITVVNERLKLTIARYRSKREEIRNGESEKLDDIKKAIESDEGSSSEESESDENIELSNNQNKT